MVGCNEHVTDPTTGWIKIINITNECIVDCVCTASESAIFSFEPVDRGNWIKYLD